MLAPGQFHRVTGLPQIVGQRFPVVSLYLDSAVLHRTSRTTQLLEFLGQRFYILSLGVEPFDQRYPLALAAFGFPRYADDTIELTGFIAGLSFFCPYLVRPACIYSASVG